MDAVYLQGSTAGYVTQQWRDFFLKLGVIDFLAVKQVKVTIMSEDMVCNQVLGTWLFLWIYVKLFN